MYSRALATKNVLGIEYHSAGFDLGQVQDLVEQFQQVSTGVPDVAQVLLLPLVDLAEHALQQHFREADHRVQRCAEFVGHAGQELRLVVARDLELLALRLELAEKACVDDRERRLAGERFEQFNHIGREVAGAASADHQHADHLVAGDHRYGEHRTPAVLEKGVQELVALDRAEVGNLEGLVGKCGLADQARLPVDRDVPQPLPQGGAAAVFAPNVERVGRFVVLQDRPALGAQGR